MTPQGEQVLVLNRSWMAIATTTTQRALSLVFRGHARIVDPDTFECLKWEGWLAGHSEPAGTGGPRPGTILTPRLRIELPGVITLATYGGVPSRNLPFSRRALMRRDQHTCQYCGLMPGSRHLTIDHVHPRSRGGPTDWMNCVIACVQCNVRKGDRTPEEAGAPLRRRPYRPTFLDGFRIGADVPEQWARFVKA
jgi:5-methylcytosine-specific restriction endonuclease McrA